ncbi:unnamed protein product [Dovyalis caffra]|uniref:C2 domain-containing protein n=1 Tax=Dovyalis caffra TaxID=77055 RepID=A0AAV1SDJ8_9ROSI|nr:unnamed protein product [Dovyalis caffra]
MASSFVKNGKFREGIDCLSEMLSYSVEAIDVSVLVFCLLELILSMRARIQGPQLLYSMKEKCGLTPKLAHYAYCMLDLPSWRGHVEEAIDFSNKMPLEPLKESGELLWRVVDQEGMGQFRWQGGRWEYVVGLKMLVDEESRMQLVAVNDSPRIISNSLISTGPPVYYVIIQCGSHVHKSKASSGKDGKTWWNEKFRFDFSLTDWKHLSHLKFRIMDQEFFTDGGFVGETTIYLGGIIEEGANRGILEMKPAPYNVVLEDDTYKGEIKIGLKFIANKEVLPERTFLARVIEPRQSICRSIINLWKFSWWRFWLYRNQRNAENKKEEE